MCTLALFVGVFDDYPLLVAANRDEHFDRPTAAPGIVSQRPKIIAGKDLRAGGTWLGVNEHGLLVGILNRRINGTPLAPLESRSRGLLCLDLLKFQCAQDGANFLSGHTPVYNPFTLVWADPRRAYVAYNDAGGKIITQLLQTGLHVFSSAAEIDLSSGKAERAHGRFAQLLGSNSSTGFGVAKILPKLQEVLGDHSLRADSSDPGDAICVHRDNTGTVSSSVIVYDRTQSRADSYYCPGPPCQNNFNAPLALEIRWPK